MNYSLRAVPKEHFGWMQARSGFSASPEARGIEAIGSDGRIRGMVVFDGWTEAGAFAHVAFDSPMAWRRLLVAACEYLFIQAKRVVAMGQARASYAPVLDVIGSVGFREVARIPDGWAAGEDLIFYQLRKEDCRWLAAERWQ